MYSVPAYRLIYILLHDLVFFHAIFLIADILKQHTNRFDTENAKRKIHFPPLLPPPEVGASISLSRLLISPQGNR